MAAVERDWLVVFPEQREKQHLAPELEEACRLLRKARQALRDSQGGPKPHRALALGVVGLADALQRAINIGDAGAVPRAALALGRLIGIDAEDWAARERKTIRERCGAQRPKKGKADKAAIVADVIELHGGQLPSAGRLKRGTVPKIAAKHECSKNVVHHSIKSARKENSA